MESILELDDKKIFIYNILQDYSSNMKLMNDIFFSGTFGGEALSIAAAIATLKKLKKYNAPKVFGLVTGLPVIQDGSIVYPCLIDGEDIMVHSGDLRKRRG